MYMLNKLWRPLWLVDQYVSIFVHSVRKGYGCKWTRETIQLLKVGVDLLSV
jgi:hypothetical protein